MRKFISLSLSRIAAKLIRNQIKDQPFCIFSNDCYGGQLYRATERPYNTPFVGLMLMAPCYIKFLENPEKYLGLNLSFDNTSKYDTINKMWQERGGFPIGKLEDIEIHFLHYQSELEAKEKWERRKLRIDWDNLYYKFAMDKDLADEKLLQRFDSLQHDKKITFSKNQYNSQSNWQLPNYIVDGARCFQKSFEYFDVEHWLRSGNYQSPKGLKKMKGKFISRFLKLGTH